MEVVIIGGSVELQESLKTLLSTPAGTMVNDRDYGISWNAVDFPPDIAAAILIAEATEKIEYYEPRANVAEIIPNYDAAGKLTLRVVLANGI